MTAWLKRGLIALAIVAFVIQFVPYGRDHENPPVVSEPIWDSAATKQLAIRACFDCHSNETEWPFYTNIAPISWFTQNEVYEGRSELNFSMWNTSQEGDEAASTMRDGSMPPPFYALTKARLNDTEREALALGLERTFGSENDSDD